MYDSAEIIAFRRKLDLRRIYFLQIFVATMHFRTQLSAAVLGGFQWTDVDRSWGGSRMGNSLGDNVIFEKFDTKE